MPTGVKEMKLENLTDKEVWDYLEKGQIESIPRDIALHVIDYAWECGYDAGVEDTETDYDR